MEKKKAFSIRDILCSIVIFSLVLGLTVLLCFNSVRRYEEYDMDYSDFRCEELTFDRYEKNGITRRAGWSYHVYFKEYRQPFTISAVAKYELDKATFNQLKENEITKVHFFVNRYSKYEIGEISSSAGTLLSLSDYLEANQNNQIVGTIIIACMGVYGAVLMAGGFLWTIRPNKEESDNTDPILGKLRIERIADGNIVRIYRTTHMWYLVINGEIF